MDNIKHLIEVLKSQVALYAQLKDLMTAEKQSIVSWAIDETVKITKTKEELLRKERILEEARKALLSKLAYEAGADKITLSDVISFSDDLDKKSTLVDLGDQLVSLITDIHAENLSIRMLYTTNSRLINEFFTSTGLIENSSGYGPNAASSGGRTMASFRDIVG